MGDEVSLRTHNVFKQALHQRVDRLDDSLESEKGPNPFLEGVEAVVEAIAAGRIECREYRRDKFRQGLHHPRHVRRGGSAGAGGVQQLQAWPHPRLWHEGALETLAILDHPEAMADLEEAEHDIVAGNLLPLDGYAPPG